MKNEKVPCKVSCFELPILYFNRSLISNSEMYDSGNKIQGRIYTIARFQNVIWSNLGCFWNVLKTYLDICAHCVEIKHQNHVLQEK